VADNSNTFRVKVASPDGIALSVDAVCVELQTVDGIIQVLPGHAPLVAALAPGELIVIGADGKTNLYVSGGGFAEVTQSHLVLLTDLAKPQDALEEEIVREAVKRAKKDLEDFLEDDEEQRALLELKLREVELQMNLVNRKKHR
jgi:F-type H+-transporting ATPase subunit epsilon